MNQKIIISDPTLRDGNHALKHQISCQQIEQYAVAAEKAKIDVLEVGHGNGLGASSSLLGLSKESDISILETARHNCENTKLGIHFIPGFAKNSDLELALSIGVDIFRIASHCTEANVTRRYIEKVKSSNKIAYGVLMMSHMANVDELLEQASLMQGYGADGIIIMDSAGFSTPTLVRNNINHLTKNLDIEVGFHAHNNLGLAVANSLTAIECGATIIDACVKGIGAGAGNTQLEVLIAVLEKQNIPMNTSFKDVVDLVKSADEIFDSFMPSITCSTIASGMYGLFSGYLSHVERISDSLNIDKYALYERLRDRKLVAGQEDIILEEANILASG